MALVAGESPLPEMEGNEMGRRVEYEWDVETVDRYGDIEDHNFHDSLTDLVTMLDRYGWSDDRDGFRFDVVLVRTEWTGGMRGEREWAYARPVLPARFCDALLSPGTPVPKRFLKEWERHGSRVELKLNK